jgi:predicted nucleic acid-binding protein
MDRVFLDANILFSAAYKADAGLLKLWKLPDVALFTSRYALEEARANFEEEHQKARLNRLSANLQLFEAGNRLLPDGVLLPDKDAPILLAAIAARATHLLTGDIRHFGPYFGKKVAGIALSLPGTYMKQRANKI